MNTKSKVKKENSHVIVSIGEVDSDKDIILKNLQDCKDGNCSCPTNEYEKLENINIEVKDELNEIQVDLKPKKGVDISINEIKKCLDHTESILAKKD